MTDARPGKQLVALERPTSAHLERIVGKRVVPLQGGKNVCVAQPELPRPVPSHNQKRLRPRTGHDTIKQSKRLRDQASLEILLENQRLLEQGVRKLQGILPLRHAQLAEILPPGAKLPHVVCGQKREAGIGSAGPVRIYGVLRKLAETSQRRPKRINLVRVSRYAGHDRGIAGLHGPQRAAQSHNPRRATHRNMIQPTQRKAKMLRQAHGGIRRQRETGEAQPIDRGFLQAASFQQSG